MGEAAAGAADMASRAVPLKMAVASRRRMRGWGAGRSMRCPLVVVSGDFDAGGGHRGNNSYAVRRPGPDKSAMLAAQAEVVAVLPRGFWFWILIGWSCPQISNQKDWPWSVDRMNAFL
ncbi:hypothetical protein FXW78_50440 [Rhodococcus opacus]|nr:hypothetical protein [Rhodococcus opacus]